MKKIYAIRVQYKNGKNEVLNYGKHMGKRDIRVKKLRQDKSVQEVVALELWE
jgi:hypothetical protein